MLLILTGIMMGRENALLPLEGGVLVTATYTDGWVITYCAISSLIDKADVTEIKSSYSPECLLRGKQASKKEPQILYRLPAPGI